MVHAKWSIAASCAHPSGPRVLQAPALCPPCYEGAFHMQALRAVSLALLPSLYSCRCLSSPHYSTESFLEEILMRTQPCQSTVRYTRRCSTSVRLKLAAGRGPLLTAGRLDGLCRSTTGYTALVAISLAEGRGKVSQHFVRNSTLRTAAFGTCGTQMWLAVSQRQGHFVMQLLSRR
jgi:hypothetical protein